MRTAILIVSALLTAAMPVAAQDSPFARPGPYLGIGGSVGFYTELEDQIEDLLLSVGYVVNAEVDNPLGFNIRAGYRGNPWLAAEVEYEYLTDADIEIDGFDLAEIRTWVFSGNLKFFPLQGRFQPFLLAGVGALSQRFEDTLGFGLEETDTVAVGRFGGGLDLYATENIALSLDVTYLLPADELGGFDADYVSIGWGAQYRF